MAGQSDINQLSFNGDIVGRFDSQYSFKGLYVRSARIIQPLQ